ncbi:P-loop containing nucleoside triphosphate hydrolase protein [Catenaria anguillulae PL171]|uniref:p-loop containing nucleoside triphosphate hydrolase protein n=1 Tax=Catenaria anguillulae PL171 TaxID=765915 RepID=A0A1Y2HSY8_9FUNG|nr:P-loop containing nucleoside triphosphate hydrolase protein [Catenaria anguillulae PL171]
MSRLLFSWLNPLIARGESFDEPDLHPLDPSDVTWMLTRSLQAEWNKECANQKACGRRPRLWLVLMRVHAGPILVTGLMGIGEVIVKIAQALLLGTLVNFFSTMEKKPQSQVAKIIFPLNSDPQFRYGIMLAVTLACATAIHAFLRHHSRFILQRMGMRMRSAIAGLVYCKSLRLATHTVSSEVAISIVSTDVAPLDPLCLYSHNFWLVPVEIATYATILYHELGWPGLLAFAVVVVLLLQQWWCGKLYTKFRRATVQWRDSRVRLITDLVQGIIVVKVNSWQELFTNQVNQLRANELKELRRSAQVDAYLESSFFAFPLLISIITFGTCYLVGITVTASRFFVSMAVYGMLRLTVGDILPKAIKAATEMSVSFERISTFLQQPEMNCVHPRHDYTQVLKAPTLHLKDVLFHWPVNYCKANAKGAGGAAATNDRAIADVKGFELSISNLKIQAGSLVAVTGPVGSGKSSLLSAIMNEMPSLPLSGDSITQACALDTLIGYAPQNPVLMSGTVLDNILHGRQLDRYWLAQVTCMCELDADIEAWPQGLDTPVGERGSQLSGGQKARVGLARAVYARTPVLLLDDPLSAVDPRVAHRLFEAISALHGITRVLVTHHLSFARQCDAVITIEGGQASGPMSWNTLVHGQDGEPTDWNRYLRVWENKYLQSEQRSAGSGASSPRTPPRISSKEVTASPVFRGKGLSTASSGELSADAKATGGKVDKAKDSSSSGDIKWPVFRRFLLDPTTPFMIMVCLFLMVIGQVLSILSDWFLANWAKGSSEFQLTSKTDMSLVLGLTLSAIVVGLVRAQVVFDLLLHCSKVTSDLMLKRVVHAPMSWLIEQPTGRMINVFAKDQSDVDEKLPSMMFDMIQLAFVVLGSIIAVVVVLPAVSFMVPILIVVFFSLRAQYIAAQRRLKRLEAQTRTPVYADLSESLEGLTVIRALQTQDAFYPKFLHSVDRNARVTIHMFGCTRWFALRSDLLLTLFIGVSAVASVMISYNSSLNPISAGLALTYAQQMARMMQFAVRMSVEIEMIFVSVERMFVYCDAPVETMIAPDPTRPALPPPKGWPRSSHVVAKDLAMRYRDDGPLVIDHWNLHFRSGERIGIVGRTGAGKSSFINALFRLHPFTGELYLDGHPTSTLTLEELRKQLALIPQLPVLFRGTLRANLDPTNSYTDTELWHALERVELKAIVESLDGKLDSTVDYGGQNYSTGHRQLLCLARALLRNAKVLVCDEATANIDVRSDEVVQHALKTQVAPDTLVLTVAHRLATVVDYDRILVVDAGRVIEQGHPHELLSMGKGPRFAAMVEQLDVETAEQLRETARDAWEARRFQ